MFEIKQQNLHLKNLDLKKKEVEQIHKEKCKISLFADDVILYSTKIRLVFPKI